MKKLFWSMIFLIVYLFSISGQTRVRFVIKDFCNDSLTFEKKTDVFDFINMEQIRMDSLGFFDLTIGKVYSVAILYQRKDLLKQFEFKYNVKSRSIFDSIIIVPRIEQFTTNIMYDRFRYYNCCNLCNGRCIDYYKNGIKRLEGEFINGIPFGKLIFYNKDGSINSIEYHNEKEKIFVY